MPVGDQIPKAAIESTAIDDARSAGGRVRCQGDRVGLLSDLDRIIDLVMDGETFRLRLIMQTPGPL